MTEKELWLLYTKLDSIYNYIIYANQGVSSWDRRVALDHLGNAGHLARTTRDQIKRRLEQNATPPKQGEARGGASSHRPKLEIVK